jgi:sigma54-dependent transcription regulator
MGYQYPSLSQAEYDSNWLRVRVDVQHARGRWSAQAPCLLTSEVTELANWRERVAAGADQAAEHEFIEPNLKFELRHVAEAARAIRVYFEMEVRPPWASAVGAPEADLFLDIPVDASQLASAAESLRTQLARFPQRTAY